MAKVRQEDGRRSRLRGASGDRRGRPTTEMSLAEKIAWWSAARAGVPRADRDEQLHVPRLQAAAHLRPVRHRQGVLPARARTHRARRVGLGHPHARRQDPPHPGRLADPRVPRMGDASPRSLSISPATAFFGKYRRFEGLLSFINYAVIFFLVVQFADRPSRHPHARADAVLVGRARRRLRRPAEPRRRPGQVGRSCPSRRTAPSRPTATPTCSAAS